MIALVWATAAVATAAPGDPPSREEFLRGPGEDSLCAATPLGSRFVVKHDGHRWLRVLKGPGLLLSCGEEPPPAVSHPASATPVDPLFIPYTTKPRVSWPEAVAIGDVNGDGRPDVVMTTSYYFDPESDFRIHVFLQNARGWLEPSVSYPTGGGYTSAPVSVALGDINGDGRADVVVSPAGVDPGTGIGVFLQNASGKLDPIVVYPTPDSHRVKLGDFNHDGRLDIVAIGIGTGTVSLFLQSTGGTLDPPVAYRVSQDSNENEIAVGDLNGDGRDDIAVMNGWSPNVGVLLQTTEGTLADPSYYSVSGSSNGIGVGDVNGDGRDDLVVAYDGNGPSFIGVFLQNASGGLNAPLSLPSLGAPTGVEVSDLEGDGRADIVVSHHGSHAVGVYRQQADGALAPETIYEAPSYNFNPQSMVVADINHDHRPDIVLADVNDGLGILYDKTTPSTDLTVSLRASPQPVAAGGVLRYVATVRNLGSVAASDVVVLDQLTAEASLVSARAGGRACSGATQLACNLGTLRPGRSAEATIVVRPLQPGYTGTSVLVYQGPPDSDTDNNRSFTGSIMISPADVSLSVRAASAGNRRSYWFTITNQGPFSTRVSFSDYPPFPSQVTWLDASRGSCTNIGYPQCDLGELLPGTHATVLLRVALEQVGSFENFAWAYGQAPDADLGNNSADSPTLLDPRVFAPNGSESWTVGSQARITWRRQAFGSDVRIDLSRDGGTSWEVLSPSTINDGQELWTVTGPTTTQALIRVSDSGVPWLSDTSDAVFAID